MQRYELEAWLGNDHGLTSGQIDELLAHADDIASRYPEPDDQAERDAALSAAYRLLSGEDDVVETLAEQRVAAKATEAHALAGLRQLAVMQTRAGESEAGFAKRAHVDRMAVRRWLGKHK